MPTSLPFRQVHLDFHTSLDIPGVGSDFDPEKFADTLATAHVNSITCFARCHHGWLYYDSKLDPARRHPHLAGDLLGRQIKACHARGIRVPVYTTVRWDHLTVQQHPEWLCVSADGGVVGTKPYEPGFYQTLCLNTPFVDFLKEHVRDIFESVGQVDGFFFDIVGVNDCSCVACKNEMLARGTDPFDAAVRWAFAQELVNRFRLDMTRHVRSFSRDCTIFYNSVVEPAQRASMDAFTHYEMESLPSGPWGYLHFPLATRYARTHGKACVGMTGKFHTSWADFHSFKNRAALEYECFRSLALAAGCSVGDQLHPTGALCPATYELIGSVYEQVAKKEPWCEGAVPVTEMAVITTEKEAARWGKLPEAVRGAVSLLQELQGQFDIVDDQSDFAGYRLLVLPDAVAVDDNLAAKLQAHVARGGAIIASHKSGLRPDGQGFAGDFWPGVYKGDAPFSPDFILPSKALAKALPLVQHVMYMRGLEVAPAEGAEVMAEVYAPYFNRTWRHFCSHAHTPSANKRAYPGVLRHGRVIYFMHPIFEQYQARGPRWIKQMLSAAIDSLCGPLLVHVEGPSTLLADLTEQPAHDRRILHLLHYVPQRRSNEIDIIEDVIPLFDLRCSVSADRPVKSVICQPQGLSLAFTQSAGRVEFTLPKLEGHQMVVIAY